MNTYTTMGVCTKQISFDIEDNKVYNVSFFGGCPGNLEGIASLVEGMDINDAINKLKGIKCGPKSTSCPDQLAKALEEYIKNKVA
ncbi:TIGR03905 family TSCPD domain-containing protein [Dethiothermospora halolimnae]|uniref:TIGR03905 family TSCPD domain-containing protein n=1 Tax=Dethiothermospora halolimnae TaxID=3114390 RepID=UPI003CCC02A1